jgi:predicted permease
VAAGLLVGSLRRLSTESLGFRADHVLIVKADLRQAGIPSEQLVAYETRVLETLRTSPGVADASQSYVVPVGGDRWNDVVVVDGYTPRDPDDAQILFNRVSTRYFATLGTRLLAGRDFNGEDIPSGARAAVVNDAFVRRFLPTSNAIGRQFHTRVRDTLSSPLTIVGVVDNTKYESIREESTPIVYLAMSQGAARPTMIVELRTVGDPAALAPAVRNAMHRENPRIVIELETLSDQLGRSISRERLLAALSAVFGAVALVLAILGLYGVMAYSVARRANEMGVRVALGADRARIVRLVLGDVGRVVVSGAAVGVLIAMGAGRVVGTFLFRTKPTDPGVLLAATTLLMLVAAVAGLVPAIRAARADPVATLRE